MAESGSNSGGEPMKPKNTTLKKESYQDKIERLDQLVDECQIQLCNLMIKSREIKTEIQHYMNFIRDNCADFTDPPDIIYKLSNDLLKMVLEKVQEKVQSDYTEWRKIMQAKEFHVDYDIPRLGFETSKQELTSQKLKEMSSTIKTKSFFNAELQPRENEKLNNPVTSAGNQNTGKSVTETSKSFTGAQLHKNGTTEQQKSTKPSVSKPSSAPDNNPTGDKVNHKDTPKPSVVGSSTQAAQAPGVGSATNKASATETPSKTQASAFKTPQTASERGSGDREPADVTRNPPFQQERQEPAEQSVSEPSSTPGTDNEPTADKNCGDTRTVYGIRRQLRSSEESNSVLNDFFMSLKPNNIFNAPNQQDATKPSAPREPFSSTANNKPMAGNANDGNPRTFYVVRRRKPSDQHHDKENTPQDATFEEDPPNPLLSKKLSPPVASNAPMASKASGAADGRIIRKVKHRVPDQCQDEEVTSTQESKSETPTKEIQDKCETPKQETEALLNNRVAEEHNEAANELFDKKQYEEAIARYTKAIECNPKQVAYFVNRAEARIMLGNYKEAIQDAKKANYKKGYLCLAKCYVHLGDREVKKDNFEGALKSYNEALSIYRSNDYKDADILCKIAFVYEKQELMTKAHRNYTDALEIDEKCVDALQGRIRCYIHFRDYEELADDYEKLFQIISSFHNFVLLKNARKQKEKDISNCPYKILRLENTASLGAIKKAYRTYSRLYHPDSYSGMPEDKKKRMQEKFKQVNTAHKTLTQLHANDKNADDEEDDDDDDL